MMRMSGGQYSGRRRRDDSNPSGYRNEYNNVSPFGGITANSAGILKIMGPILANMDLKEHIGSPLVFAGLAIGMLLTIVLLSIGEFMMMKRAARNPDNSSAKYENVTLT